VSRRAAILGAGAALIAGLRDPAAVSAAPSRPFPPRGSAGRRADPDAGAEGRPEASGGWWLGTAGLALALAVCGGISVAIRRGWGWPPPGSGTGRTRMLRVLGRASLSPRHTVHLLGVGGRVLIVGTGPQGAPSLLGELTDPEDLERLLPLPRAGDDR
jgi:hypothetical protein